MRFDKPKVYAAKHCDFDTRMSSRSGGVFSALSDVVLEQNGVVYGCIFDEDLQVIHARATSKDTRDKMRGSKYAQSNLRDTFRHVKEDLDSGLAVLFSGTTCQVDGLLHFLGKGYENLITVDILCHGVPSPALYTSYLSWQEKRHSSKIVKMDFRNKKDFGWNEHVETLVFENGKTINARTYAKLYYKHTMLRPSCYSCPYKKITRPSAITIADYWGINKAAPGFDDNNGVSLVLVNTEEGSEICERIREKLDVVETRIEDSMQHPLIGNFKIPENREQFWQDYQNKSFGELARKYGGRNFKGAINALKRYRKDKIKFVL